MIFGHRPSATLAVCRRCGITDLLRHVLGGPESCLGVWLLLGFMWAFMSDDYAKVKKVWL